MSRRRLLKTIFFDIETTGLSKTTNDIIEIAGVVIDENFNVIDTYQSFINPGKPIPFMITQITGIDNNTVKTARSENVVLADFMNFVKKHQPDYVGGHNIKRFDLSWIEEKTNKYRISNELNIKVIDTLDYAKQLHREGVLTNYSAATARGNISFKLEHLVSYFELADQTHRAIDDVMQNIVVYKKLKELEETIDYGF